MRVQTTQESAIRNGVNTEQLSDTLDLDKQQTELLLTPGAEHDARRRHAAPQWSADPTRMPDLLGLGPDADHSEDARRRFFGEDVEREIVAATFASAAS